MRCQQCSLSRTNFQPELMQKSSNRMRFLLVAVMSITALVVVLIAGASGSQDYTTHIGQRVPPSQARCVKTGELSSDDGRLLSIFQCPVWSGVLSQLKSRWGTGFALANTASFEQLGLQLCWWAMIPEPHELFDIDKGADKVFFIGTTWIVLFLFLL